MPCGPKLSHLRILGSPSRIHLPSLWPRLVAFSSTAWLWAPPPMLRSFCPSSVPNLHPAACVINTPLASQLAPALSLDPTGTDFRFVMRMKAEGGGVCRAVSGPELRWEKPAEEAAGAPRWKQPVEDVRRSGTTAAEMGQTVWQDVSLWWRKKQKKLTELHPKNVFVISSKIKMLLNRDIWVTLFYNQTLTII